MPTRQEHLTDNPREVAEGFERAIGARVRDLRLERSWSQADLAERMTHLGFPMHQATVAKLEAAQRPIRAAELYTLAMAFGLPPSAWWYLPVPGEPGSFKDARDRLQNIDERIAELEDRLQELVRTYAEIRAARQRIAMEMDAAAQRPDSESVSLIAQTVTTRRRQ